MDDSFHLKFRGSCQIPFSDSITVFFVLESTITFSVMIYFFWEEYILKNQLSSAICTSIGELHNNLYANVFLVIYLTMRFY